MDLYAENILDHFRTPRKKDRLSSPTITQNETNTSCGDSLTLDLSIEDGKITNIGWDGLGCAISQAGMSILTEELQDMSIEKAMNLSAEDMYDMLGVPIGARRIKCALLCVHALKNALHKYRDEEEQDWNETIG